MVAHQLAGLNRHKEITANVDLHGFLERTQVCVQDVAELRIGRRVVDQNIDAAKFFADPGKGAGDLFHFADMAGDGRGFAALGDDRISHRLAAF